MELRTRTATHFGFRGGKRFNFLHRLHRGVSGHFAAPDIKKKIGGRNFRALADQPRGSAKWEAVIGKPILRGSRGADNAGSLPNRVCTALHLT